MKINKQQSKLVELTLKIDLKSREYSMLCKELETLKSQNLDPNCEEYQKLLTKFEENSNQLLDLKNQLAELKKESKN